MYNRNFKRIIEKKIYPLAYTNEMARNIKLINVGEDKDIVPFGSATYRIQPYPADLDLIENYYRDVSKEELIKDFAKRIKKTIKNISEKRLHYISEVKIGIDTRYYFNIGKLENGIYWPYIDSIRYNTDILYKNNLLDDNEVKIILGLVEKAVKHNNRLDQNEYDIMHNLFRNHYILRWSEDEILRGYKKLQGNEKITIEEGLIYHTPVKIDMITPINNKMTEVTNFLLLIDKDKNIINLGMQETNDLVYNLAITGLPKEIEKLFYSEFYYSPFKGLKRIWALARALRDKNMISKVTPFIKSNVSFLYSLKSELDTILRLYEIIKNPPKNTINMMIDNIKYKLSSIIFIDKDELIKYYELLNGYLESENIEYLNEVKTMMKYKINEKTEQYIKYIVLFPLPNEYLPNPRIYI